MHTYPVGLSNRIHQGRIGTVQVALAKIILRRWPDGRKHLVKIFVSIVVRQHVWVVLLRVLQNSEGVFVGVIDVKPKPFLAKHGRRAGPPIPELAREQAQQLVNFDP